MDKNLFKQLAASDIFDYGNPVNEAIKKLAEDVQNKKTKLVKQKLKEKGFGHLIEGMEKRIFPRVARVVQPDGWELYFADDGTDSGLFIIGFKDVTQFNQSSDPTDYRVNYTTTFQYVDKLPLVSSL